MNFDSLYGSIFSISTFTKKFNNVRHELGQFLSKSIAIPVVLVVGGVLVNAFFPLVSTTQAVFGGPAIVDPGMTSGDAAVVVAENFPDDLQIAKNDEETAGFIFVDAAQALSSGNPLASALPSRDGLLTYRVQKGDTLSSIAASFGISLNTVIWANSGVRSTALKPGAQLVILPVSGIVYHINPGDSVQSVAALYNMPVEKILKYNPKASLADVGQDTLIIPDAKPQTAAQSSAFASLPSFPGYFAIPTTGWNWGRLHANNGVDIANACGTLVYASAEGLVSEASHGWNGGYGSRVIIKHPNNTETLYAHLSAIAVEAGEYVSQGQEIGKIGNEGNVIALGAFGTACHLHFEVHAAQNPFAK